MLCGRAPFQTSREKTAVSVMHKIKAGNFDFDGDAWNHVSLEAKHIIQGNCFKIV
jgi:hypothetical protein